MTQQENTLFDLASIPIEKKLYQPEIIKQEVNDEHYYFVDGKFYPSVTKILSEAMPTPAPLKQWMQDMGSMRATEKFEQAGARGTLLHNACESLLLGQTIDLTPYSNGDKKCLVGFKNWFSEFQPSIKGAGHIEMTVASMQGYAGTLDILCEINGEPWIVDIKTSSGVYDSHKLQQAAYQQAIFEMYGYTPNIAILHLNPKAKHGYIFHKELEIEGKRVDTEDFMTVFNMYKMLNGGNIPEPNLENVYPDELSIELIFENEKEKEHAGDN